MQLTAGPWLAWAALPKGKHRAKASIDCKQPTGAIAAGNGEEPWLLGRRRPVTEEEERIRQQSGHTLLVRIADEDIQGI